MVGAVAWVAVSSFRQVFFLYTEPTCTVADSGLPRKENYSVGVIDGSYDSARKLCALQPEKTRNVHLHSGTAPLSCSSPSQSAILAVGLAHPPQAAWMMADSVAGSTRSRRPVSGRYGSAPNSAACGCSGLQLRAAIATKRRQRHHQSQGTSKHAPSPFDKLRANV